MAIPLGNSATPELVEITTSNGARVGQRLDEWTALHPDADVDLIGPVDWIGPIVTLENGLVGYLDTDGDSRVMSVASTLTGVCDE